jgi:hypothetical protein
MRKPGAAISPLSPPCLFKSGMCMDLLVESCWWA